MTTNTFLGELSQIEAERNSQVAQSLFVAVFGIFMVGVVGFAQIDAVHNAAHDTRHAFAFPCH